jgi:hypothetical protein
LNICWQILLSDLNVTPASFQLRPVGFCFSTKMMSLELLELYFVNLGVLYLDGSIVDVSKALASVSEALASVSKTLASVSTYFQVRKNIPILAI